MMFYARYTTTDGEERGRLYYGSAVRAQLHADAFRAGLVEVIPFCASGNTYAERRESVKEAARRFRASAAPGLTRGELETIYKWFEKQGKQYGLLREFKKEVIF